MITIINSLNNDIHAIINDVNYDNLGVYLDANATLVFDKNNGFADSIKIGMIEGLIGHNINYKLSTSNNFTNSPVQHITGFLASATSATTELTIVVGKDQNGNIMATQIKSN